MRGVDLQLAFPFILLALSIVALLGPTLRNIIIVFAVTTWPVYARTTRSVVLVLRNHEFVQAARGLGRETHPVAPSPARHREPRAGARVLRGGAHDHSRGGARLSRPRRPATPPGAICSPTAATTFATRWWIATFPGLAIMITAAGANFLGDGLRDMLDPTLQNIQS